MERIYSPDCWKIVHIKSQTDDFYKVLASWYGGFAGADEWRLSSGIEGISVSPDGKTYTMPQSSGSVYVLGKGDEHMSSLLQNVFTRMQQGKKNYTVELATIEEVQQSLSK